MRAATSTGGGHGDLAGWIGGSGIVLVQLCAVIPGLLPGLLIAILLGLPFLILGAAGALIVAIAMGVRGLAEAITGRARRSTSPSSGTPAGFTQDRQPVR